MGCRTIKIQFKNWYDGFNYKDLGPIFAENNYLKENDISLEITNANPDFIIYGVFGDFLYQSSIDDKNAVKILFVTEPISSDFLFFDYCIGFEPYDYGKRNCFYPFFLYSPYADSVIPKQLNRKLTKGILKSKDIFCEMVYSHDGRDVSRKKYFELLSTYKKVESAGTYLNNQLNGATVDYRNDNRTKFEFQKRAKFSLCIQSIKKEWFINEKIMHAFFSNEIPIFYGCDEVKNVFNPERFVFVDDYPNDEALLKKIIEIDNNDELFCEIISKPVFIDKDFVEKTLDKACRFVYELLVHKKKRLIEKNRETIIKNEIIKNKRSSDELHRLLNKRIIRCCLKVCHIFRKRRKHVK